jgi:conjugal transfer pilus assembly protein TraU
MKKVIVYLMIFLSAFGFSGSSFADLSDSTCPDAGILGAGLIDKVCWSCVFPIVLFGVPTGGGTRPDNANQNMACSCNLGSTGISTPGFSAGLRSVGRLMEVVRDPHCSPGMGGIKLLRPSLLKGQAKKEISGSGEAKVYKNVNSWSFPLLYMIEAVLDKNCTGDATTMNLIGLSSVSPTWSNDELAFHLNPESIIFSNPAMMFFALADGAMINAAPDMWGNSAERDTWFWTIGSWSGSLYPLTGEIPHSTSSPRESALVTARSLALSHRLGQSRLTMGSDNMCGGSIYPMIPKSQYKISQIYPQAQSTAPCCMQMGETSFKWNEWRTIPGFEDYLFVIFRWTDCCVGVL